MSLTRIMVRTPLLFIVIASQASWLSDKTGMNIDLQRAVGVPVALKPSEQPQAVPVTAPASVPIPMAKPEQISVLREQTDRAVGVFAEKSGKYEDYANFSFAFSIVIALAAAIAGFARKPVIAGVLSIIIIATNGAAKAFPLQERVKFYDSLVGQSTNLQLDLKLKSEFTVTDFNSKSEELKKILLLASNPPGLGDTENVTHQLVTTVRGTEK